MHLFSFKSISLQRKNSSCGASVAAHVDPYKMSWTVNYKTSSLNPYFLYVWSSLHLYYYHHHYPLDVSTIYPLSLAFYFDLILLAR